METHIEFTQDPIEIPALEVFGDETGSAVEFRGIVRATERGETIGGLYYEAYLPMARLQLERIMAQLCETWQCQAVWFVHRLGWVPVGEASLYVCIHASHREPAFRFCMELIDRLKKDVPVWKLTLPPGSGAEEALPRRSG